MCRRIIGALLIMSFFICGKCEAVQYAYAIYFTDKNSSPYSLSSPLSYLSSRALARRSAQGIAVDSSDLPVNPAYIHNVLALTGGIFHESSRWLNMCVILLADSTYIHTLDGVPYIRSKKYVAYYSTALHLRPSSSGPADPAPPASRTSSTDNDYYGNTWPQTTLVNGNVLHDKGYDGTGRLIAVLDAGFLYTDTHFGFDSLRNSGRILESYNFTYANTNVYAFDNHGTQVLSTMAGYVPNLSPNNFVGTAPKAYYALYVTEDDNSEQIIEPINMLCGTERADSIGADVITTSLGYNTFDDASFNYVFTTDFDGKTTFCAKAANMATQKGILFVATAGNEGGDSWNMILTPGDADSALTIGSVDNLGTPASNSGYGPNAAGQVKPDVCAMGVGAIVFSSNSYEPNDGTSFSTPQVAGWAASLWQANPSATPYQLRQAIIRCASAYSAPTTHIGYGVPDFQCTEHVLGVTQTPPFPPSMWVEAAPNPFSGDIKLAVSPEGSGIADFTLTDMAGRSIVTFHQYLYSSTNRVTIPLPPLPAGSYILRAVNATQLQVLKVFKTP